MARPQEYIDHILRLVDHFGEQLRTCEYDISVEFVEEIRDGFVADIKVNPKYLTAYIRISDEVLTSWSDGDWRDVADTVLHELCHIITEPLYLAAEPAFNRHTEKALESLNEQATQRICNAVLRLTPESVYVPAGSSIVTNEAGWEKA